MSLLDSRLARPGPPLKCIICRKKLLVPTGPPICSFLLLQMTSGCPGQSSTVISNVFYSVTPQTKPLKNPITCLQNISRIHHFLLLPSWTQHCHLLPEMALCSPQLAHPKALQCPLRLPCHINPTQTLQRPTAAYPAGPVTSDLTPLCSSHADLLSLEQARPGPGRGLLLHVAFAQRWQGWPSTFLSLCSPSLC